MKCGGEGDPGAASRAARLIHGAGDLQRVQQDPHVQASLWNASVKVQKTVVEGISQHYKSEDRSLAAMVFSDASMVGWDQMRKVQAYKKDPETNTPVRMTLHEINSALSDEIKVPCFDSARTNARRRNKLAASRGGKSLEDDGSSYQVRTLTDAMVAAVHRKGQERAEFEINEMVIGGDAVQCMKGGHVNVTNVALKGTGSHRYSAHSSCTPHTLPYTHATHPCSNVVAPSSVNELLVAQLVLTPMLPPFFTYTPHNSYSPHSSPTLLTHSSQQAQLAQVSVQSAALARQRPLRESAPAVPWHCCRDARCH